MDDRPGGKRSDIAHGVDRGDSEPIRMRDRQGSVRGIGGKGAHVDEAAAVEALFEAVADPAGGAVGCAAPGESVLRQESERRRAHGGSGGRPRRRRQVVVDDDPSDLRAPRTSAFRH